MQGLSRIYKKRNQSLEHKTKAQIDKFLYLAKADDVL
jgi:hypothetical protein